ncbi:MAG: NAD(P)/FAD-dependent oxidoreductase [Candidatus Omnitrophica bacterium]|nr:NAD(P)/FAD-dependent oxidoreductase [Candidatus Omnitrophota bacterium]
MNRYDVIIIGGGIGGLTCGCYLSKKGLKVLLVEQHSKVGGYCTSFNRQGYTFDAGPHYLGSLRKGGTLFKILRDLDLLHRVNFIRDDPTDRIITPDKTIFLRTKVSETKKELSSNFPQEKDNLDSFFDLILNVYSVNVMYKLNKITFKKLLDYYFTSNKLKAIFSLLLFGAKAISSRDASALIAVVTYREFFLDGGYYPKGGMQTFADLLAQRYCEYGGELLLNSRVTKIITRKNTAIGIEIGADCNFIAKYVVSNADSAWTFKKLLEHKTKESKAVDKLSISQSAFAVYLGLNKRIDNEYRNCITWFFPSYNIKDIGITQKTFYNTNCIICAMRSSGDSVSMQERNTLQLTVIASYRNNRSWNNSKNDLKEKIISTVKCLFPQLEDTVVLKETATPCTFQRYTSNRRGAIFGLQETVGQISRSVFPDRTTVKNLYLVGHWVTNGIGQSGIPTVAFCGKNVAGRILQKIVAGDKTG